MLIISEGRLANTAPLASSSIWHQPHSWLTAAGIAIAFFSLLIAAGFVRGYLGIALTYFGWYFAGESSMPSAVLVIVTSAVIPIMVSIAGTALLLLKKYKRGISITLVAVATYFIMDVIYIGSLWDGHHVIYAYTNSEWFLALYYGYGSYGIEAAYSFYFLYIPALLGIAASLMIGRKKTKSQ